MKDEMTFFEKLKKGLCRPKDIDDYVDKWHDGKGFGMDLHEYLGMTWKQFKDWGEDKIDLNRFYNTERDKNKAASKKE